MNSFFFLTTALAYGALAADTASPISPARMSATVKTLSSDAFEGRAPGTPGEAKTVAYLIDRFRSLGLKPAGDNGDGVQSVPLIHNVAHKPARRGALAAFVIHETAAAGYGWNVAAGHTGCIYDVVRTADQIPPPLLRAWIAREAAVTLFAKVGLDLGALKRSARDAGFRPVELKGARFSIDMPVTSERVQSRNVLAQLPGKTHPGEAMMPATSEFKAIRDASSAERK